VKLICNVSCFLTLQEIVYLKTGVLVKIIIKNC